MTLSLFAIVAASVGVAAVLRTLETEMVSAELVRREIVPVRGDRCAVQGVYRFKVDGRFFEQVIQSDVVRRSDDVAMRTAIRALTATKSVRHQPEAPELFERADGAAVPVLARRAS